MKTKYRTINSVGEGLYKEKGSKFIAWAIPVNNIEQIETSLRELRAKYHDARHHCYAYILGYDSDLFRANDDGEPNHSAGDPILGQIRSAELTNTLVVVIRYFGGTKLGVSGLLNAYKTAAKNALDTCTPIVKTITSTVVLQFPYNSTNETMKLLDKYKIQITSQTFESKCEIKGEVPLSQVKSLLKRIDLLNKLGIEIAIISP